MANLSQIKREQMVSFIEMLKEQHTDDESLIALNQIERELTIKKYGIVWENHEEHVDEKIKTHIPVFVEDKNLAINSGSSDDYNFLLEGDNLHSLKLLEKTHSGRIDVIYIDPPYNTEKKDFIYEDTYVDSNDGYRHSKWLSFMYERLVIASKLLKKTGVIFISIDDNELYQLKMICDEIFGDNNFLGNLIIQTATDNNPTQVNTEHEYMLVYAKDKTIQEPWYNKSEGAVLIQNQYLKLKKKYSDCETIQKELRKWIKENKSSLKQVEHYNNVDEKGVYSSSSNSSNPHPGGYMFDIKHPITGGICPKPANGWRWPEKTFLEYDKNGEIAWGADHTTQPHVKKRIETAKAQLKSIIYADNRKTTKDLADMLGPNMFDNPKSPEVLKRLFGFCSSKDALFLDFFAGSGTTAQAVLELNSEDDGCRNFVLCTNNENNICRDVTYQRIKTVITGKRPDGTDYSEGIPANLKYYKTDFVDRQSEALSDDLLDHVIEMIQLQYGVVVDGEKYVVIMNDDEMDSFEANYATYRDLHAVFINQDVLLSTSQEQLLSDVSTFVIPNCYFDFELREAGELW